MVGVCVVPYLTAQPVSPELGDLQLRDKTGIVEYHGNSVHLPPQLYRVFSRLCVSGLTPDEIAETVRDNPIKTLNDEMAVRVCVQRLRQALGPLPFKVVNYKGYGYELVPKRIRSRTERDRENERRRSKAETFREKRRLYMKAYRDRH